MFAESWFRSLWKTPLKDDTNSENLVIGVLAFEVASLMSKLVNLWQSLSDKQVAKLREEITNSVGIRKLVSDDENFAIRSISLVMFENMAHVAESVARLAKKCSDPSLKDFEYAFDEFINLGVDPYGWQLTCKKMDKKVKRMEKFISTNASSYQEMEVLADTLERMKAYNESDGGSLIDYQKKAAWKRLKMKKLKDNSLWNKTYNFTVHLLARSLFTIFSRINNIFGIQEIIGVVETKNSSVLNSGHIHGCQSVSELLQSSVYASENYGARFASGPLSAFTAKSDRAVRTNKASIFHSGPLVDSFTKAGPISGKYGRAKSFSCPPRNLEKPVVDNGTVNYQLS